jgi:hypothetical protein
MTDYGTQPFAFTATAAQAANIANNAITVATKATQKFLGVCPSNSSKQHFFLS